MPHFFTYVKAPVLFWGEDEPNGGREENYVQILVQNNALNDADVNSLSCTSCLMSSSLLLQLHGRCRESLIEGKQNVKTYMQKAGDTCDISPQFFLDFPQNFRLRTRNQYCTQAIA